MELAFLPDEGLVRRAALKGRISQVLSPVSGNPLAGTLASGQPAAAVLLNLAETEFIDSSGLAWLLLCHKRFRADGSRLILHSIPAAVMDAIKVLQLHRLFEIASDERAAMALVNGGAA